MDDYKYGISWKNYYAIGDEKVDMQHRQIFELLSELVDSCMDGSAADKLHGTLDFLVNYAVQHFYDEESLQVQYNYPEYKTHKQLHDDFKVTIGDIVRRYDENGSSAKLSDDVNKIVVRWLINHIQREDKKIGEYIRKQQE